MSLSVSQVTSQGLTLQTLPDLFTQMAQGLMTTYGPNIDLNPESPDANLINIFCQGQINMLQFGQQVYNSYDPDQAQGIALDLRCAINNVKRRAGTYTQQAITITTNLPTSVVGTLVGLDTSTNPFTVSDNNGVQYELLVGTTFDGTGTFTLAFQASNSGPVQSALNTIQFIVGSVNGVASVTNGEAPTFLGTAQETDAQLRLRRQQSVALPSKSWYQGLYAAITQVASNIDAIVYENQGAVTDSNGVPGHSIWVIIDDNQLLPGPPTPPNQGPVSNEYAKIIYIHKGAGCGQKVNTTNGFALPVETPDGSLYTIYFDIPILTQLYVSVTATTLPGGPAVDAGAMRQDIYDHFSSGADEYTIATPADFSAIVAYLKDNYPGISFGGPGVSLTSGSGYANLLLSAANSKFVLGTNPSPGVAANILINGT
jgi:hypothetical protein